MVIQFPGEPTDQFEGRKSYIELIRGWAERFNRLAERTENISTQTEAENVARDCYILEKEVAQHFRDGNRVIMNEMLKDLLSGRLNNPNSDDELRNLFNKDATDYPSAEA